MNKSELISAIQKYYLNGKCKDVRWEITNGNLYVDFLTDDAAVLGTLECNVDWDDNILAVFNTDRLLSMLSVLDDGITGTYDFRKEKPVGVSISDGSTRIYFALGDLAAIPDPRNKIETYRSAGRVLKHDVVPAWEIQLDATSVSKFLKGKKALSEAKTVALVQDVETVQFVINYSIRNENNIKVSFPATQHIDLPDVPQYNVEYLAAIFAANDDYREAKMIVTDNKLICIEFVAEDYKVKYYIKALE